MTKQVEVRSGRSRFSEGLLRVAHAEDRLPDDAIPDGVSVRDATAPGVTYLLSEAGREPRETIAALLSSGADIRGFSVVTPTLEEIFVRIVGEKG